LFLDEIGEMPVDLQAKLLRFLENKTFHKVGGVKEHQVDVRVLCATNRDPQELVASGAMREDLYYRVSQVTLRVPSLRERKEDITLLALAFLHSASAAEGKAFEEIEPDALAILKGYHWPGNVRQLWNVITEIAVLHDGHRVLQAMLPADIVQSVHDRHQKSSALGGDWLKAPSGVRPIWQMEKEAITEALYHAGGNVAHASEQLELSPATMYRKIKRYAIRIKHRNMHAARSSEPVDAARSAVAVEAVR
jgi:transcriptional regulator with PAS, ATPase and Fis domain